VPGEFHQDLPKESPGPRRHLPSTQSRHAAGQTGPPKHVGPEGPIGVVAIDY
jgi:hypothetical protein